MRHFTKKDSQLANKHMKDVQHHKSSGKCKLTPQWSIATHLSQFLVALPLFFYVSHFDRCIFKIFHCRLALIFIVQET